LQISARNTYFSDMRGDRETIWKVGSNGPKPKVRKSRGGVCGWIMGVPFPADSGNAFWRISKATRTDALRSCRNVQPRTCLQIGLIFLTTMEKTDLLDCVHDPNVISCFFPRMGATTVGGRGIRTSPKFGRTPHLFYIAF